MLSLYQVRCFVLITWYTLSPAVEYYPGPVVGVVLGMLGSFSLGYIIDDGLTEITLTVIVCFSAFMISEATKVNHIIHDTTNNAKKIVTMYIFVNTKMFFFFSSVFSCYGL